MQMLETILFCGWYCYVPGLFYCAKFAHFAHLIFLYQHFKFHICRQKAGILHGLLICISHLHKMHDDYFKHTVQRTCLGGTYNKKISGARLSIVRWHGSKHETLIWHLIEFLAFYTRSRKGGGLGKKSIPAKVWVRAEILQYICVTHTCLNTRK